MILIGAGTHKANTKDVRRGGLLTPLNQLISSPDITEKRWLLMTLRTIL